MFLAASRRRRVGVAGEIFFSPPNVQQWTEVDDSVKTALEKHPRLTKYTVCFPINLPDPRVKGQESFIDKWDKHVDKWKTWAAAKKMAVEFEYWDASKIVLRLSRAGLQLLPPARVGRNRHRHAAAVRHRPAGPAGADAARQRAVGLHLGPRRRH